MEMLQERYTARLLQVRHPARQNNQTPSKSNHSWPWKIVSAAGVSLIVGALATVSQAAWLRTLDHAVQAFLCATLISITGGLLWVGIVTLSNLRQKTVSQTFKPELLLHDTPPTAARISPEWILSAHWQAEPNGKHLRLQFRQTLSCGPDRIIVPHGNGAHCRRTTCRGSIPDPSRAWRRR